MSDGSTQSSPQVPRPDSIYAHLRKAIALPGVALVGLGLLLLAFPNLLSSAQIIGLTLLSVGAAVVAEEFSKAFERRETKAESVREAEESLRRFEVLSKELQESKGREVDAAAKLLQVANQLEQSHGELTESSLMLRNQSRLLEEARRREVELKDQLQLIGGQALDRIRWALVLGASSDEREPGEHERKLNEEKIGVVGGSAFRHAAYQLRIELPSDYNGAGRMSEEEKNSIDLLLETNYGSAVRSAFDLGRALSRLGSGGREARRNPENRRDMETSLSTLRVDKGITHAALEFYDNCDKEPLLEPKTPEAPFEYGNPDDYFSLLRSYVMDSYSDSSDDLDRALNRNLLLWPGRVPKSVHVGPLPPPHLGQVVPVDVHGRTVWVFSHPEAKEGALLGFDAEDMMPQPFGWAILGERGLVRKYRVRVDADGLMIEREWMYPDEPHPEGGSFVHSAREVVRLSGQIINRSTEERAPVPINEKASQPPPG